MPDRKGAFRAKAKVYNNEDFIGTDIAARLRELGVPLYRSTSVGDNPDRLKAVIGEAIASSDLVITTGGLGPTDDDLTKETVAELLGLPLVHDGEAEENIRARLRGSAVTDAKHYL